MKRIFFDTEFTGLHQKTTLISIGLVVESGETFYAELSDYSRKQVNPWLQSNVLDKLTFLPMLAGDMVAWEDYKDPQHFQCAGPKVHVAERLKVWLSAHGAVQMWSDCLAYDWVLFNALLADYSEGYPQLPSGVHYIPMDICPLFQMKGIDPDVSREEYAGNQATGKHNALHDALIIKACYDKLMV